MRRVAPILMFFLGACAHAPKGASGRAGETVEAEGWAALSPQDAIGSRQRALADAQKRAIEKVTGLTLSARTDIKNAISVDQRISALMNGTIAKYEILGEREEDGFIKILIRALVLYKDPEQFTQARHDLRVRVAIENPVLSDAACKALQESGFPVTAEPKGEADVIVTGIGKAYPLGETLIAGFISYRAQVTLSAQAIEGGKSARQTREASAIDPAGPIASDKALENAAHLAGEALALELAQFERAGQTLAQ